jgi:sec-independent protein translocase protein TatC
VAKTPDEMPIIDHFEELRRLLIIALVSTFVLAIVAYCFIDQILAFVLAPLKEAGQRMNYTGIAEPIIVKIKLSLFVGFVASLPVILWKVWSFVIPALKKNEKVYFTLFVIVSFLCFLLGVSFCFFGIYTFGVLFLLQFAGPELNAMLTIDRFISFTIGFVLPFGFIFELPLIAYILAKLEMISYRFIASNRKYALLIIVVLAALITPPDVFTLILVSGPVYVLFEFSALIIRLVERNKARARKKEEEAERKEAEAEAKAEAEMREAEAKAEMEDEQDGEKME